MKKLNLELLTLLALLFISSKSYAAAAAGVGGDEDGLITKTAVNKFARKAIDIMAVGDAELHREMSRFHLDPSERDDPLMSTSFNGAPYSVWGEYKAHPMTQAEIDAKGLGLFDIFLKGEEVDGETKYLHIERYEEVKFYKTKRSVKPAVFEELEATYPFLTFYKDLSFIEGAEKDRADSALEMPAKSAVDGGTFPKEGFVTNNALMIRLLNKETGEISVVNGPLEEDKDFRHLDKILSRLQGASAPSQIDVMISSLLFGSGDIALGQLLISLGYTETRVMAYPQITKMTRIFRSKEAEKALTVPEIAAYNAAMDENAYGAWQKEHYRLTEAGESTEEHEKAKPEHPEYPDVPRIIQTTLITPDGSVKAFLDLSDFNQVMYYGYKPDLPKDDGRTWYDFSMTKFKDSGEESDEEVGVSASATSADPES